MTTTRNLISSRLRLGNSILATCLFVVAAGCSKQPASSVDISGTWIEPVDLDNNSYTTWDFKSDGSLLATLTLVGHAQDPEAGTYKARPTHGKLLGDIIECSFPKRGTPTLFRIPPNASTMIVRVDTDDDAFSADRPERRVTKAQTGQTGPSEAQRRSVEGVKAEGVYKGRVLRVEPSETGGYYLRLDTTIHGKKFVCAIMDTDLAKFGDVMKLKGKQIEVKGTPEESKASFLLIFDDSDQLKVLE